MAEGTPRSPDASNPGPEHPERPGGEGPTNGHAAAGGLLPAGTIPSQRCTARRSNGQPCKRWAIVGGTVCPTHGGSAPQVKEAARRRLEGMVPQALDVLAELLLGDATNPHTGDSVNVPAAVRARVAAEILTRAGLNVPTEHDITVHDGSTPRPDLDAAIQHALASRGITSEPPPVPAHEGDAGEAAP